MKRLINILAVAGVLLLLTWVIFRGIEHRAEREEPEEAAAEESVEKPERFVVKLEPEQSESLGIEKAKPEKTELKPQNVAFGRVLDPSGIITLEGDLSAAEAALQASQAEFDRTQKLLAAGESTSKRSAETAQAQYRADQLKLEALVRRVQLEWGELFSKLEPGERRKFADDLVRGTVAVIRVDVLPGDAITETPKRARIAILGRDDTPIETESISVATDVDPKTQAQSFILSVSNPPFPLRPGMALTSWLESSEPPRQGYAVPRSAILRHDGLTWVYVQTDEEHFRRKTVRLDTPLDGERGWFVPEDGGIDVDDFVVTVGAQSLLSEELKSQGGGEPE